MKQYNFLPKIPGIQLLESFCQQKVHLSIPVPAAGAKVSHMKYLIKVYVNYIEGSVISILALSLLTIL